MPIKDKDGAAPDKGAQMGLKFQMRYSVPLFVSGKGVWTKQDFEHPRDYATANQPKQLPTAAAKQPALARRAQRRHRARSPVAGQHPGKPLNNGLLGYVLPGSQMRFALPPSGSFAAGKLQAMVNDNKQPVTIPSY